MKYIWYVLVLLLCLAGRGAGAQGLPSSEAFLPQAEVTTEPILRDDVIGLVRDRLGPQDRRLFDDHLQTRGAGAGHFGLIQQDGAANVALMDQEGASNLAVMVQHGTGNTTQVSQTGTDNAYGAWLTGTDNELSVTQRGDDNVYLLEFAGDGLAIDAAQLGTGNQAVQLGAGAVLFGIEQRGDGMTLIIRHDTP